MPKPLTDFATVHPITCTETTLTVNAPLPHMEPELANAIAGWLHDHDLDENLVVLGTPIIRAPDARTLTWTGRPRGVPEPTVHVEVDVRTDPPGRREPWPAPFPDMVLNQPRPDACPTCGRSL